MARITKQQAVIGVQALAANAEQTGIKVRCIIGSIGGVQVLLMDGSVRFIGNSIDRAIWLALGSRAGGEVAVIPD